MKVIVQDLPTHYESLGTGKTILFLHGWADRLETFSTLSEDLKSKYTLLSLDLPGFGQTSAPTAAWDLDNYALFVSDFLQKVGADNIFAVVGHSNGGALAIRAISTNKLKCQKLILLSSSGVRDNSKLKRTALVAVAKSGKAMTFWLKNTTRQKLQNKLYGTVGSDMLIAPHLKETFKQIVRQDIQADATRLQIPTLLVYGDHDRATPVNSVGIRLHNKIKDSILVVVHEADHFVHLAQPTQVLSIMKDFLK